MKSIYRPEIDGLRAIAVGAVILYHAKIHLFNFNLFKGGFIGVDIFFVISGYLITLIILKSLINTGSFSFKYFYERRIRRILPVLLIVMLISLPFALFYLMPSSLVDFSKSIIYSLGFTSNFYFHYSGQVYGDGSGMLKPFLHTWSLSVEEQYYILFPIALYIAFKHFRENLLNILIIIFIFSLTISDFGNKISPSATFYFLLSRMWELLAGSILAYYEIELGHRSKNKTLNIILPKIGLFLIWYYILFVNIEISHPSFNTLIPIIGVCLIIWFSNKNEIVTKILSSRLFVGIGLISYSLYLWHYPIFAFDRIIGFTNGSLSKQLVLVSLVLIASILSYYLIEKPARNNANKFRVILFFILSSSLIIIFLSYKIISNNGYSQNYYKFSNLKTASGELECERENFNKVKGKEVITIGNSHAYSISNDLKKKIKNINFSFGCINVNYYPDMIFVDRYSYKKIKTGAPERSNNIKKFLTENKDLTIIYFSRITHNILDGELFDNKEGGVEIENENFRSKKTKNIIVPSGIKLVDKLERQNYILNNILSELNYIKDLGHNLIIVYPLPEVGFNAQQALYKFRNKIDLPILSTDYEVYKKRNKLLIETYDQIYGKNVFKVYPDKLFCDTIIKERCVINSKKTLYYYDDNHISLKGSELINELIINEIKKIKIK